MLTDLDRKEPLVHGCNYVTFHTNLDLSIPVKVIPYGSTKEMSIQRYSQDLAAFISWWNYFVLKDLNGFSGFSNVEFEFENFKII